jgi:hypothetical protein
VFDNLAAVAQAAGGSLADTVKLNVFLTDLSHFASVNQIMAEYFHGTVSGPRGHRRRRLAARRPGRNGRSAGAGCDSRRHWAAIVCRLKSPFKPTRTPRCLTRRGHCSWNRARSRR